MSDQGGYIPPPEPTPDSVQGRLKEIEQETEWGGHRPTVLWLAQQVRTLLARVAELERDQQDWRKGVALIASALGEAKPPDLSCVRIADRALEQQLAVAQERIAEREAEDFVRVEYPSGNWAGDIDAGIADALVQRWNAVADENQRLHILAAPRREVGET